MKAYTLKKHKTSGELHLFEGEMTPDDPKYSCTSDASSICKKMKKTDSISNEFSCRNEDSARKEIAKIGRNVCGVCVSHLYASY